MTEIQEAISVFDEKENEEKMEKFFRFIIPYMEGQLRTAGRERE